MKFSVILLAVAIVMSAPAQQTGAPPSPPDMHNSRTSLDWPGTYEGILPCPHCSGSTIRLTLNHDGTFQLVTQARGTQTPQTSARGAFTWQPSGNAITLDEHGNRQQFAVGEGRLTLLGREGDTSLPPNLVLTLVAPASGGSKQSLDHYRWTLVSATDANNRPIPGLAPSPDSASADHPVVLTFDASRLSIQGPCNRLISGYQLTANQLNVSGGATTRMACDQPWMDADTALFALLAKPMQLEMTGRPSARLRLVSPGNGALLFTGEPTPESLYGPATTVFLEIAPQLAACPNPPAPNSRCLLYRERHFDEQGLAVGTPGVWQPLTVNIEGFTHHEGTRNVLRVKEFQRPASADGTRPSLYVLDLVVESETVKP